MPTTFDVRVWKTEIYHGQEVTTYRVRWKVGARRWKESFRNAAQAESFRAELLSAARKGEAFDVETGRPASMRQAARDMGWYQFACMFADMKWPDVAGTTRRTHAEALTAITVALFTRTCAVDGPVMRAALGRWAFNTNRRNDPACPDHVRRALRWAEANTRKVTALTDPHVLRHVVSTLGVKLDGTPGAPSVVNRRRRILNTAVEYAVELQLLTANPLPTLRTTAGRSGRTVRQVDRRSVANPIQVRTLLLAVREQRRSGPRLVAFFACLYFAGLRPEEAVGLAKHNLSLPAAGWGMLHLDTAEPYVGKDWTDTGTNRDRRQLKQRERGETRTVPCPPELTALLHWHIDTFGVAPDGRIFTGERNNGELPKLTIIRAWAHARVAVFTPDVLRSPLAKTPYDLRHAAVSTWLNGGVPATRVAEWAGHSVEILHKIYAKCIDGEDVTLQRRVQAALGHPR